MSKNWIDLWQYSFSKIHLSLGKLCEDHGYSFEWTSGQKPQTHQRWQTGKMQHGELRTNRCPWFIDKLLNLSNTYISNISLAGSKASRFDKKWEYELPSHEPAENEKKKGDIETVRRNPLRDLPEWLEEFTENLVDESVPVHRDATATSSRESASELRTRVVSGKRSIYTHFPKDKNCEFCMRTKITRAPCRKRTGTAVPRAENVDDLITADHKVLSEGRDSRNNHQCAVVVQDLATQWNSISSVQN